MKNKLNITIFSALLLSLSSFAQAETVRVYAAASLSNAMNEMVKVYNKQQPQSDIVVVYGASSTLAKQIEVGAKSDLYFSADLDWMRYLIHKNQVNAKHAAPILSNQLVVIASKKLMIPFKADQNFDFAAAFKGHLCTGQMESVPVGKYAKQSLIKMNWLNRLKGRIVGTDDVRSALAFVERGECEVGIVYKTDALISRKVKMIGVFPENTHDPILYSLALTKQGEKNTAAVQFLKFIRNNPQALHIFQRYGFMSSSSNDFKPSRR